MRSGSFYNHQNKENTHLFWVVHVLSVNFCNIIPGFIDFNEALSSCRFRLAFEHSAMILPLFVCHFRQSASLIMLGMYVTRVG